MNRAITAALLVVVALSLVGCDKPPGTGGLSEVVAETPAGGIVRFSGVLVGDLIRDAQKSCQKYSEKNAVPISFYKIGVDTLGRDQVMTFECK
jgi:hypothetical protein